MAKWPCWGENEDPPTTVWSIIRAYNTAGFKYKRAVQTKQTREIRRGPCCSCEEVFKAKDILEHAWLCVTCLEELCYMWINGHIGAGEVAVA